MDGVEQAPPLTSGDATGERSPSPAAAAFSAASSTADTAALDAPYKLPNGTYFSPVPASSSNSACAFPSSTSSTSSSSLPSAAIFMNASRLVPTARSSNDMSLPRCWGAGEPDCAWWDTAQVHTSWVREGRVSRGGQGSNAGREEEIATPAIRRLYPFTSVFRGCGWQFPHSSPPRRLSLLPPLPPTVPHAEGSVRALPLP